jgi:hypothetical protein
LRVSPTTLTATTLSAPYVRSISARTMAWCGACVGCGCGVELRWQHGSCMRWHTAMRPTPGAHQHPHKPHARAHVAHVAHARRVSATVARSRLRRRPRAPRAPRHTGPARRPAAGPGGAGRRSPAPPPAVRARARARVCVCVCVCARVCGDGAGSSGSPLQRQHQQQTWANVFGRAPLHSAPPARLSVRTPRRAAAPTQTAQAHEHTNLGHECVILC